MNIYAISTILAGVLWGLISIFLKNLSGAGFTSLQVMFIRSAVSAVLLFFVLFFKNKKLLKIELKDIWMFLGTGVVSLTFFSICYFTTILTAGASVAVILLYTSPIFILILSCILFNEKITVVKIVALVLTFAGCVLVSGMGSSSAHISVKVFLIGLCAGLGYALYSIFSRFALKKYNSFTVSFYTFVFSSISIIPFCNITAIPALCTKNTVVLGVGIAFFCSFLPYLLYTFGLSGLENGKAAILVTIEPLVGTLIGIFLWKETVSFPIILGIALIFTAVVLVNFKDSEK